MVFESYPNGRRLFCVLNESRQILSLIIEILAFCNLLLGRAAVKNYPSVDIIRICHLDGRNKNENDRILYTVACSSPSTNTGLTVYCWINE